MRQAGYIFILLLLIPVQTTVVDHLSIYGIKPDLGLIIVYWIGFGMGEMDGVVMGVLIGTVMDLFSGGVLGTNLLTKPIIGGLAGLLGRVVLDARVLFSMGILFGLSILSGFLIYLFLKFFEGEMAFGEVFRWIILPQALYDAAVGALLFSLVPRTWRMRQMAMET